MSERVLLVSAAGQSHRFVLPALGSVTIGRGLNAQVRVDAPELSEAHAVLFLDEEIAISASASPVEVRRAGTPDFRAISKGETVDLALDDQVRLGAVELSFEPVIAASPSPRLVERSSFAELCFLRMHSRGDAALTVARIRPGRQLSAEELDPWIQKHLRPGALVSSLERRDLGLLIVDATRGAAERAIHALAKEISEAAGDALVGISEVEGADLWGALDRTNKRLTPAQGSDAGRVFRSDDPGMRGLYALVDRAAASTTNVLLTGETGVGKDVLAALIHDRSPRAEGPFVRMSGVDVSEALSAEGASEIFHRARGGTVYLDEISGLTPRAQLGLGYALEAAQADPSGARIIASSNRDLIGDVESGALRKDLYYRLAELEIRVPPLRERPLDVLPLAQFFLEQARSRRGASPAPTLSPEVEERLRTHSWPGNARELKNVVEHALLLTSGDRIELSSLPPSLGGKGVPRPPTPAEARSPSAPLPGPAQVSLRDEIAALEKRRILEALKRYPTQREAADALQMPMRTFINRLDALQIPRPRSAGKASSDDEE
ncbi:MAG: sigma 54-interacting transcriptional regulator [Myxococcota bacterium]